jgi:PIN domain nuclease of toxin-antitoxin system
LIQKKITFQVRDILLNNNYVKVVSGISLWEFSLKYSLGKLDLKCPLQVPLAAGSDRVKVAASITRGAVRIV